MEPRFSTNLYGNGRSSVQTEPGCEQDAFSSAAVSERFSRKDFIQAAGLGCLTLLGQPSFAAALQDAEAGASELSNSRQIGREYQNHPKASPQALKALDRIIAVSRVRDLNPLELFKLSPSAFKLLKREIGRAVIAETLDFKRFESVESLSKRISTAAEKVLSKYDSNPNLVAYVHGSMIINWVRTHLYMDSRPDSIRRPDETPVLDKEVPATICGRSAWICGTLAELSQKTWIVKAEGRLRNQSSDLTFNHAWEILVLPSGHNLVADAQLCRLSLRAARERDGDIDHPLCLPLSQDMNALFIAYRYAYRAISVVRKSDSEVKARIDKLDIDPLFYITASEWNQLPVSDLSVIKLYLPNDGDEVTWSRVN